MSEKHSGERNPFFGRTHTLDARDKFSAKRLGKSWEHFMGVVAAEQRKTEYATKFLGLNNPFFGKRHTDESRRLISTNHVPCSGSLNPMFEQGDKIRGELNGSWQGGISGEDYGHQFTDELKKSIRVRDQYTCRICRENGHVVHHVNYVKFDCSKENLVTLCVSCHARTNFNREQWIEFFTWQKKL